MTTDQTPDHADAPERRVHTEHDIRRLLHRLALDWFQLQAIEAVPSTAPRADEPKRVSNVRTYGHPTEWVSDTRAMIATEFWWWHQELAEHRGETPPRPLLRPVLVTPDRRVQLVPRSTRARHRTVSEQTAIVRAWKYLEPRIPELIRVTDPETEPFQPAFELHSQVRSRLGLSRRRWTLVMPCPACELKTLQRSVGFDKRDYVVCGAPDCNWRIDGENYPLLVRMLVDTLKTGS